MAIYWSGKLRFRVRLTNQPAAPPLYFIKSNHKIVESTLPVETSHITRWIGEFIPCDELVLEVNFRQLLLIIIGVYGVIYATKFRGWPRCIDFLREFQHANLIAFWQIIIMESENDKIKYWKYKLSQKQKNVMVNEPFKTKPPKSKSPDKKKTVHCSTYLQDNFFSNTLDKLKHLLEEQPTKKHDSGAYTKRSKDNIGSKSTMRTNTEPVKKVKTVEVNRIGKSISIVNTIKIAKKSIEVDKNKLEKGSASPKKSKSRSKSKKYKVQKSKELAVKPVQKHKSPIKKPVKKKSKCKEPVRKIETIHLSSFSDTDPMDHKSNQSVIVHEVRQNQEGFLYEQSNFKKWEEQEERRFVERIRMGNRIAHYLHGFIEHSKYVNVTGRSNKSNKGKNRTSLKTMIKSQQQKLLELKNYLKQLKGSENLNDNLEMIINKVNENIVGLKQMEQVSSIQSLSDKDISERRGQVQDHREHLDEEIEQENKYLSPQQLCYQPKPILMLNSLCITNLQDGKKEQVQSQGFPDCDHNLKGEIYSLPKNNKVDAILIENGEQIEEKKIIKEPLSQKQAGLTLMQYALKSDDKSSLLLSAESKSQIRLLSPDIKVTPIINISISNFVCKKEEEPTHQNNQIKEEENQSSDEYQMRSPVFETNNKTLNDSLSYILQQQQLIKVESTPLPSITMQMRAILCDQILTCLIVEVIDCFQNHKQWLQKLILYHNNNGDELEQVKNDFNQIDWPIQSNDAYLIQLAEKVINVAQDLGLREKISKPLGVSTLTTLRYMRHFDQAQETVSFDEEFNQIDRYVEILDQEDFQHFEIECSCNPDHAEQHILNRCVYDVLNILLDQLRPYGSKGRPAFCFGQQKYVAPPLPQIHTYISKQLKKILNVKLGLLDESGLSEQQMREAIGKSLARYNADLIQEIQRQYGEQTDDGLQTYQLMVMIESQVLVQQARALLLLQNKRALTSSSFSHA